jgi:putative oxidoreductase
MKKLFYHGYSDLAFNLATLILRVGLGVLMIPNHGWAKLSHFAERKEKFMSFMGLGSTVSLGLATFAEFFCSLLLILGLFTRLATIPLLVTIFVILGIHNWKFFGEHELVPAFLFGYLAILLLGPGKFSLDARISKK